MTGGSRRFTRGFTRGLRRYRAALGEGTGTPSIREQRHVYANKSYTIVKNKSPQSSDTRHADTGELETIPKSLITHISDKRHADTGELATIAKNITPYSGDTRHADTGELATIPKSLIGNGSEGRVDGDSAGAAASVRLGLTYMMQAALVEGIGRRTGDAAVLHDGASEEPRALVEGAVTYSRDGAGDDEVAPQA